jgi:hypothetical protein
MSIPIFGGVDWVNTHLTVAMDEVAEATRVKGQWEKVGNGYRLKGPARRQTTAVASTNWWLFTVPAIGFLLFAGGIYIYRMPARKQAPKAS